MVEYKVTKVEIVHNEFLIEYDDEGHYSEKKKPIEDYVEKNYYAVHEVCADYDYVIGEFKSFATAKDYVEKLKNK